MTENEPLVEQFYAKIEDKRMLYEAAKRYDNVGRVLVAITILIVVVCTIGALL